MPFSPEDKKALSDIRFEKASEFLEDAHANFRETRLETAINRSYYAACRSIVVNEMIGSTELASSEAEVLIPSTAELIIPPGIMKISRKEGLE